MGIHLYSKHSRSDVNWTAVQVTEANKKGMCQFFQTTEVTWCSNPLMQVTKIVSRDTGGPMRKVFRQTVFFVSVEITLLVSHVTKMPPLSEVTLWLKCEFLRIFNANTKPKLVTIYLFRALQSNQNLHFFVHNIKNNEYILKKFVGDISFFM